MAKDVRCSTGNELDFVIWNGSWKRKYHKDLQEFFEAGHSKKFSGCNEHVQQICIYMYITNASLCPRTSLLTPSRSTPFLRLLLWRRELVKMVDGWKFLNWKQHKELANPTFRWLPKGIKKGEPITLAPEVQPLYHQSWGFLRMPNAYFFVRPFWMSIIWLVWMSMSASVFFGKFTFFKTLTKTIWDSWVVRLGFLEPWPVFFVKKSCRWMVNEVPGRVGCPSTCRLLGQSDLFLADLWLFQLSMHWFCSETCSLKNHPWEFIYKESWIYKNGYWDLHTLR